MTSLEVVMGKMVGIAEFKAHCTRLLREMREDGEPITVTHRGKVVGVMSPPQPEEKPGIRKLLGSMKGTVTVVDDWDETGPIDSDWEAKWEAKWDALGLPASKAGPDA